MKELKKLICKTHCKYYKENKKEEYTCKGLAVLDGLLERESLAKIIGELKAPLEVTFKHDRVLSEVVCRRCDFFIDGCDFRDTKCSYEAPPCGGFLVISYLTEKKIISVEDIKKLYAISYRL